MAPTTKTPTSSKGANPAPNYMVSMNSIQLLMSSRSKPPGPPLQAPKPTTNTSSMNQKQKDKKTPAQIQREDEEANPDRFAGFDDNIGVGMFKPENSNSSNGAGPTTNEGRKREREDKMLRGRFGLLGRRKAADGPAGGGRARRGDASSDEDEGRSGIGRAKKRRRRVSGEEDAVVPEVEMVDEDDVGVSGRDVEGDAAGADDVEPLLDEAKLGDGIEEEGNGEGGEDLVQPTVGLEGNEETSIDQTNEEASSKKKRKKKNNNKKKKKKPKNSGVEANDN